MVGGFELIETRIAGEAVGWLVAACRTGRITRDTETEAIYERSSTTGYTFEG